MTWIVSLTTFDFRFLSYKMLLSQTRVKIQKM